VWTFSTAPRPDLIIHTCPRHHRITRTASAIVRNLQLLLQNIADWSYRMSTKLVYPWTLT